MEAVAARLRELGDEFSLEQIAATRELFTSRVARPADVGAVVVRDLAFGPDPRHRLDVFRPATARLDLPVVVFVHGGGFVQGDKGDASSPFYNNFGAWAVSAGFIGVTLTYRLAPAHPWPAGAADLERAVGWIRQHIGEHGGAPERVVLTGQSAGATHVAGYLARQGCAAGSSPQVAAAVMFSGMFEFAVTDRHPMYAAYFGTDYARYPEVSTAAALGTTLTPCLFTVSEFDPQLFQRQAAAVVAARAAATGRCPELLYLVGHNHVSSVMQLTAPTDSLGPRLAEFVRRHTGAEC